jgi:hypothetical protein
MTVAVEFNSDPKPWVPVHEAGQARRDFADREAR